MRDEKRKQYEIEYRIRNAEKLKAYYKKKNKIYYWKNKGKENERCKKYHWSNRLTIKKRKDPYNRTKYNIEKYSGIRFLILERDNYRCQRCGLTMPEHFDIFGKTITIHHIDGKGYFAEEKNNDPDNLITLCLKCHGKIDSDRYWNTRRKEVTINGSN